MTKCAENVYRDLWLAANSGPNHVKFVCVKRSSGIPSLCQVLNWSPICRKTLELFSFLDLFNGFLFRINWTFCQNMDFNAKPRSLKPLLTISEDIPKSALLIRIFFQNVRVHTLGSKLPFKRNLKRPACASKWDGLVIATIQYSWNLSL